MATFDWCIPNTWDYEIRRGDVDFVCRFYTNVAGQIQFARVPFKRKNPLICYFPYNYFVKQ